MAIFYFLGNVFIALTRRSYVFLMGQRFTVLPALLASSAIAHYPTSFPFPATGTMESIIILHHELMCYLIIIVIIVV